MCIAWCCMCFLGLGKDGLPTCRDPAIQLPGSILEQGIGSFANFAKSRHYRSTCIYHQIKHKINLYFFRLQDDAKPVAGRF